MPRGWTVADAMNQANGATQIIYTHDQAGDVNVEITPQEMGIDGVQAVLSKIYGGWFGHLCKS